MLNSGHSRSTAFVLRAVAAGDDFTPRRFETWCACAIALIGTLPPSLYSRSIHIGLRRLLRSERVEPYDDERMPYGHLGRQAARWAADNLEALCGARPELPEGFTNRLADNWRPLLAIADQAGGDWPSRAREAALTLTNPNMGVETRIALLASMRTLVEKLADMEPEWAEFGRTGKPITQKGVANLLKPFGVFPQYVWDPDEAKSVRAYLGTDLEDTFNRYLPPEA